VRFLAAGATLALGGAVTVAPVGSDGTLEEARRASEREAFTGEVSVRWVDDRGVHHQELEVRAGGGVMVVRGPNQVMAREGERFVRRAGEGWRLLWPDGLAPLAPPPSGDKYGVTVRRGPVIAERATIVVELRRADEVRERLYLDQGTRLLVRREQLDHDQRVRRSISFERLSATAATVPEHVADPGGSRPAWAAAGRLPASYRAPESLSAGYRRIGAYHRPGLLHVMYSDGVYGLSVFEQPGRLDRASLPARGRRVRVGRVEGRFWTWAGGDILLWSTGGTVYTAIGDGPLDEIVSAAGSIPAPRPASTLEKVRRACRGLLDLS
jgi:hypothetical protein